MAPVSFSLAAFSGICFATVVFHLFTNLRSQSINTKQITIDLFAMACSDSAQAGLLMGGVAVQPQSPVVDRRVAYPRDALS